MNILLCKTTSARNVLLKTLGESTNVEGTLRSNVNVLSPVVRICGSFDTSKFNYCYIPDFGRYYFIEDWVVYRAGVYIVNLSCDELMSWRDEILRLQVVVSRLTDGDKYISGNDPRSVKPKISTTPFPNSFIDYDTGALVCVGKGAHE